MKTFHGFHPPGCMAIKIVPNDFVEHGAYVQDVRYALTFFKKSAGAKTGDATMGKIDTYSEVP